MLRKVRKDEEGFTLIELLVVILIVGILAAIALPTFLGQQDKGRDASTKSDVRNAVSHVESCFTDEQDYTLCEDGDTAMAQAKLATGVDIGATAKPGPYKIAKLSESGTTFTLDKAADGTIVRTCDKKGTGGCNSSGSW